MFYAFAAKFLGAVGAAALLIGLVGAVSEPEEAKADMALLCLAPVYCDTAQPAGGAPACSARIPRTTVVNGVTYEWCDTGTNTYATGFACSSYALCIGCGCSHNATGTACECG